MGRRLERLEKALLAVMGPASIGDPNAPARELPPRPVELCTKCGQPQDAHEVVRAPRLTYTRCPEPPA